MGMRLPALGIQQEDYNSRMASAGHGSAYSGKAEEIRLVVETIPGLVWSTQPDGSAEFFNPRWLGCTGLSAEQALDWGWKVSINPDDLSRMLETFYEALDLGPSFQVEGRFRRWDGEIRWFFFSGSPLYARMMRILIPVLVACCCACLCALPAAAQNEQGETLGGPDSHETGQGPHGRLLGTWGGERTRLQGRGVKFDFQYVSDSLWNLKSQQAERFASWDRFRATVDVDFGALIGQKDLYFHATGLWQGGGNLGAYLGLLASPSGMSSERTARLDSWWIEKRWLDKRLAVRVGQFAAQDFYGAQHYAASFIFEPMGYALGNLFTDFESFDPPSTPAVEVRVVPIHNLYMKSMVEAEDRNPFAHNPTGFVPQFRGVPVSISEIGFTPGKKATSVRAFDSVESRKGYSGLYQFGASYNPGKFTTASGVSQSGSYLLYWMVNQALWRLDPKGAKGLDGTFAFDWSPANVNRNNTMLTAGLRFNEPLPLRIHNTMSLGYVQNRLSQQFVTQGAAPTKPEHGIEFNTLLDPLPMLLLQPVIQYYANVSGRTQRAVVFGFRTKVEF
jgi:porin